METAAVADLAEGPIVIERDPYVITLAIDDLGDISLTTKNGDKRLKSVPAKFKKDDEVAALRTRKTELTRQKTRMRTSLEASMIRGDTFDLDELESLLRHPLLRPMLHRLIWVDEAGFMCCPLDSLYTLDANLQRLDELPIADYIRAPTFF